MLFLPPLCTLYHLGIGLAVASVGEKYISAISTSKITWMPNRSTRCSIFRNSSLTVEQCRIFVCDHLGRYHKATSGGVGARADRVIVFFSYLGSQPLIFEIYYGLV